jgi:hypothetical protein
LVQLRQRISIRAHLSPFKAQDTHAYIERRLQVAGYDFKQPLFTAEAESLIAKYSEGIPRNINNICFNALSLGCVLKQRTIEKNVIREVLNDLEIEHKVNEVWGLPSIGGKGIRSKPVLQNLTWPSRVALFALMLMPLLWAVVRTHSQRPAMDRSAAAITRALSQDSAQPAVQDAGISSSKPGPASKVESQAGEAATREPIRQISARSHSQNRGTLKVRPGTTLAQPPDPATLWNQVKQGRSDAEVELARIYEEGIGVERNCMQARVLLQDASRKGNTQAADLITDFDRACVIK